MARWGMILFWRKEKPKVPHINDPRVALNAAPGRPDFGAGRGNFERDVELELAVKRVSACGSKLIGHKGRGNGNDSRG